MTTPENSIHLSFGTQLSLAAASFTGSAVSIGSLVEMPAMIIFDNATNQDVFVADNSGATKGITLTAGEKIILDCVTNKGGFASYLAFKIGTTFYATAASGTGTFRIGVLTAQ